MAEPIKIRPREDVQEQWGSIFDKLKYLSPKHYIGEIIKGNVEAREKIKEFDPDRSIGFFENFPGYSGIGDWNFKPEVTEETEEFTATGERKKPKKGHEPGRVGITDTPEVREYQRQVLVKKELEKLQKEKDAEAAKLAKEKAEREAFSRKTLRSFLAAIWDPVASANESIVPPQCQDAYLRVLEESYRVKILRSRIDRARASRVTLPPRAR